MVGARKFGGTIIGPWPAPVAPMLSTVQLRPDGDAEAAAHGGLAVSEHVPREADARPDAGSEATLKKWVSYYLIPENGMPLAGYEEVSNVPCRTYGKVAPVFGLIAILFAVGQVAVVPRPSTPG